MGLYIKCLHNKFYCTCDIYILVFNTKNSVLDPKLYTLYISDLPPFAKTKTAVYADDTAIYSHSYYTNLARAQLQIYSNIL